MLHSRLLLRVGNTRAALDSTRGRPEPESLLLYAEAACAAGLADEARDAYRSLLSRYAVDALAPLVGVARSLCRAHPERFPGWLGLHSTMRLVGELSSAGIVSIEDDVSCLARIEVPAADGTGGFSFELPWHAAKRLRVRTGGRELLGSGLSRPADFGVRGWVMLEGRTISGEVWLDWCPHVPVQLAVVCGGDTMRIHVDPATRGPVGWCFSRMLESHPGTRAVEVSALLPDGRSVPLAGSPLKAHLVAPRPIADRAARAHVAAATATRAPINIVVPVYRGLEETLRCLHSVLKTMTPGVATLTVIDDASPEPELRQALGELAAAGRLTLLRNDRSLGFPGAANRGMRLHPDRDVVLLNSDTEVFDGWLERLAAAAYAEVDIGTVTPLGEAASIASYPPQATRALSSAESAEINRIAGVVNRDTSIEIPVGVGYCLYVRRRCLDETGEFDEEAFGRGYGEENDFCLRARHAGWRHVLAAGLFVRHTGGRSYGAEKQVLITRNSRLVNLRHPGYDGLISGFIARDPLRGARRAIDQKRLLNRATNPVLLLTFELEGGVKRHVEERQAVLSAAEHTVLLLRAAALPHERSRVMLSVAGMDLVDLVYDTPHEFAELRGLLLELGLTHIEVHHFLGLSGEVLDLVLGLGVAHRVFVHDYTWICPRVSLLNGDGVYCGEPPVEECEACVRTHGSALTEALSVAALRARSARILRDAQQVFVPSDDVRRRILRYFPALPMELTPWESARAYAPCRPPTGAGRVRVALIGAISTPKGYSILLACARDAAARDLPLEFVVIGYTREDAPLLETARVFITGPFKEEEAPALLQRECCDMAFFPSQTPETWCYALTYALEQGLPIVAFDLGAVAERLRSAGTGVLLPLRTAPQQVNDALLRLVPDSRLPHKLLPRLMEGPMQQTTSSANEPTPAELNASVQTLALPVGMYVFTVKSGASQPKPGLALPAFHVAPAPVRSECSIEFQRGPGTIDRWLTRPGDVITVKVSGIGATLLLTSLRGPDSDVLSIDVRRLDAVETAEPVPQPEVRARTIVHVQNVGDLEFTEGWAGRLEEKYWIEGFSVVSQEPARNDLIEYRAVRAGGEESGWLSGGILCGARGTHAPLTAFAVRVKEAATGDYVCGYSGKFLSGQVTGPLTNGDWCRGESADDPLVGIELHFAKRPTREPPAVD